MFDVCIIYACTICTHAFVGLESLVWYICFCIYLCAYKVYWRLILHLESLQSYTSIRWERSTNTRGITRQELKVGNHAGLTKFSVL